MSSQSDALLQDLHQDLSPYLDQYQLDASRAGKPLWPDATVAQAQAYSLATSIFKKYNEDDKPSVAASQAALQKFLAANKRCEEWKLVLADMRDEELLGDFKMSLYRFFNPSGYQLFTTYEEVFSRGGLGKGANRCARGSDLFTKVFNSPLSSTTEAVHFLWTHIADRDPRWNSAVKQTLLEYGSRRVAGNKLSFVNKNVTTARCISTEPTLNMWFQRGIGDILADGLKKSQWNIDLSEQPEINGWMARVGSQEGRLATIDLESASDSISLEMCKAVLPSTLLDFLMATRSPTVELPDGSVAPLHMMSTMGNGFTFPLQTAIFSAVIAAAYRHHGIKLVSYGPIYERNFGVFGDDMICDVVAVPTVVRLLGMLGFVVNRAKSFFEGPFRESCGMDWFAGSFCRGVYIKRLRTKQDHAVAINALNRWSALTGIRLCRTVSGLLSRLKHPMWVPAYENDDAGVQVPFDMVPVFRKRMPHGIVGYTCYAAIAKYLLVEDETIVCGQGEVQRSFNPDGLWLCFLNGNVEGYRTSLDGKTSPPRISLRQREVRYTTKRRVTSSWNTLSPIAQTFGLSWRRWSDAVRDNLYSYCG